MNLLNHDLAHEFASYLPVIEQLKSSDAHFASLVTRYETDNRTIASYEQGVGSIADEALEAMKKKRLLLKDEIYQRIKSA